MAQIKKIKVNQEKVQLAIETGIPLTVTTYTLPLEMEQYISDILAVFLKVLNHDDIIDGLTYCVKELVNNAKKANTKRVYFKERGLDLFDQNQYDEGMKTFKTDTITNIHHYLEEQRKQGYFIKVVFQVRNNKVKIEVANRSELTFFEYKRIHDKISRGLMYSSVEEGISQLLDDTEGAGLGLVIMILILRKIGLSEENFQIVSENGQTVNRVFFPLSPKTTQMVSCITSEFAKLVEGMPEFPENITRINSMINSPDSKLSDIALEISNDVSLTGELLKMVNSAAYILSKPCNSIEEAVKLIGLRGIENLLFSIGSMGNLMSSTENSKKLWYHSYQVGFFSYNLARNFAKTDRKLIEDSYVCGLLHDMGKIVFECAKPDQHQKIQEMCARLNIPSRIFENLLTGINHAELGSIVARKWNFPQVLIDVIRYHHCPDEAPENHRKISEIIYVADMIAHYNDSLVDYDQIDTNILKSVGIISEEQFQGIAERLAISFRM